MKIKSGIFLILLAFFSCSENSSEENNTDSAEKRIRNMLLLPDSLRSPEANETLYKAMDVLISNMKVMDNKIHITISKKEFEKTGIPAIYYDMMSKDIQDINNWADTASLSVSMMESFVEARQEYLESRKENL